MPENVERLELSQRQRPADCPPGEVAAAIRALAFAVSDDDAVDAYHRVLFAVGNDHRGSYFPIDVPRARSSSSAGKRPIRRGGLESPANATAHQLDDFEVWYGMSSLAGIDPAVAAALGFRKAEYTAVERERRWLCASIPRDQVRQTPTITDLYVQDTRLRLRDMRPSDGGVPLLRLSRKADIDARTRLITSIYLPEAEFVALAAVLKGQRLTKTRYRLHAPPGVVLSVDEFHGDLAGLILAEAEFQNHEALMAFAMPPFAVREVTDEPEYTGGWLAHNGPPPAGGAGRKI